MRPRRHARPGGTVAAIAFAVAFVVAAVDASAQTAAQAAPQATTSAGRVEGRLADGLAVFRGMPYAAPPVGALRWQAPQPAVPWQGVRAADAFGAACPQDRAVSVDQAGDPGPTAEDCLFVNVWTPRAEAGARLPVMVWIHGGAFVIGSAGQAFFDGAALARRGAVVVTLNYRLGALGFFSHPALDRAAPNGPVNFGLLDQIAALRWVRDHIEAFGGDAGNVTVFGESAGGQSVLALFASPAARGLFHKGIVQSAYGIPSHTRAKARATGVAIASAAGLNGADATLADLRALPAEALVTHAVGPRSLSPSLIVGDAAMPAPLLATFQRGREAALPLVIGHNSDEASVAVAFGVDPAALVRKLGAARVAIKPLYPGQSDDAALGREVVRDVVFGAYARRLAWLHAPRAPTWRYYFSRVAENQRARLPAGVPHGGEIPAVFGNDDACGCLAAPLTEADRAASRQVVERWSAFARDGEPRSAAGPDWPRDGRRQARTLEFGAEATLVREDFMARRLNAFIGVLNVVGALPRR